MFDDEAQPAPRTTRTSRALCGTNHPPATMPALSHFKLEQFKFLVYVGGEWRRLDDRHGGGDEPAAGWPGVDTLSYPS